MNATRWGLVLLVLAALVATAWWALQESPSAPADVAPSVAAERSQREAAPRAPASSALTAQPQPLAPLDDPANAVLHDPEALVGPLRVTVRHAHGPPASGGMLAIYAAADDSFLLRDALDEHGAWEHPGFDEAVTLYVVGVSKSPGELSLARGRGTHELVLPAGAWLAGRVLVDGAPPGRRFPINVTSTSSRKDLPHAGHGVRQFPLEGESESVPAFGRLYTRADGSFVVSGFDSDSRVAVSGPGGRYFTDEEGCSGDPITELPKEDYVLLLRSSGVIDVRVINAEGAPVHDFSLMAEFTFTRLDPVPSLARSKRAVRRLLQRSDEHGRVRFKVPATARVACLDADTGEPSDVANCGPLRFALQLHTIKGYESGWLSNRPDEHRPPPLLVLEGLLPGVDLDLGEVVVDDTTPFEIRVLDTRGAPVPHALLSFSDLLDAASGQVTHSAGENGVFSPAEFDWSGAELTVAAKGFEVVHSRLPTNPPPEGIEVTLPDGAALEVELLWPDAVTKPKRQRWVLGVSSASRVFSPAEGVFALRAKPRRGPNPARRLMGQSNYMPDESARGDAYLFDARGTSTRLEGLFPGVTLQLNLRPIEAGRALWNAELGEILWTGEITVPAAGGVAKIEVDLR